MRAMAPARAPPIVGPRWEDGEAEGGGVEAGRMVWMIMFVVVMRAPLAAEEVMTERMELVLMRFEGVGCAAAPPALLVVEVEVEVDVDDEVDVGVVVGVGVVEVEEVDEEIDEEVEEISLDVVSALPGFPMMATEAAAGPLVLIEATEVPLGNGKKSFGLVLSQQTLVLSRLWSQHQFPP